MIHVSVDFQHLKLSPILESCDKSAKSDVQEYNTDLDTPCIAFLLLMVVIPLASAFASPGLLQFLNSMRTH